jgi:hypothetical protein
LAAITNVCKPTKTETVKKKVAVKRHGKTVKVTKKVSKTVAAPRPGVRLGLRRPSGGVRAPDVCSSLCRGGNDNRPPSDVI